MNFFDGAGSTPLAWNFQAIFECIFAGWPYLGNPLFAGFPRIIRLFAQKQPVPHPCREVGASLMFANLTHAERSPYPCCSQILPMPRGFITLAPHAPYPCSLRGASLLNALLTLALLEDHPCSFDTLPLPCLSITLAGRLEQGCGRPSSTPPSVAGIFNQLNLNSYFFLKVRPTY